jgi:hypothetical protein
MFQMIEGAPEFRDFVHRHCGKGVEPRGAARIYVSRSALPTVRGSVLGEAEIEARLAAEGYEIFHPQKHPFAAQIAAYRAAREVVAVDCSPLHLLALVGDRVERVGVIARRDGRLDEVFARQIRAFRGAQAWGFDHLRRNWIEDHATRPSRTSWGELDLPALGRSLAAAGLIRDGDWPELGEEALHAQLARIKEATGVGFKPWTGPGPAPGDED